MNISECLPCDVGISTTSSIFKLVVSLLRSVIKLVSLCGIGETQKRGMPYWAGDFCPSQWEDTCCCWGPIAIQLVPSSSWNGTYLAWCVQFEMILDWFGAWKHPKTVLVHQLLLTICLLVEHVICSATDRKSKPNLDGLNRRKLKMYARQTEYCHVSG